MARQMTMRLHREPLIVDCFAGGGGASTGIEMALGRSPDIAINHDPEAVAMHAENHPATRHFCESVWKVDPIEATQGRPVDLAWFSPDCTFFSRARGSKPIRRSDKPVRSLAWVVVRWAKSVRPRVILCENVCELLDWGPLDETGRPCAERAGITFRRWWRAMEAAGYTGEFRKIKAHHHGAPTTRERLFIVFRCDGEPIEIPAATHGPGLLPYRTAAECMDWARPCPSIFARDRPLVENTLARIARAIDRYVVNAASPFIVPGSNISPALIQMGWGEREGQEPRVFDIHRPLSTVVAGGIKHALVAACLARHFGGSFKNDGAALTAPLPTITTQDHHAPVYAFLDTYYGSGGNTGSLREPLRTITMHDRFALVTVKGEPHRIVDVGQRMLVPRELYRAQGFPDRYRIDFAIGPKPLSKTAQVRMVGNSVAPHVVAALVSANYAGASQRKERAA